MDSSKIYGLCLERLKFQIRNTKAKASENNNSHHGRILLESYCTGNTDEIIDILEIYDAESNSYNHVCEKLDDLAYTISLLMKERLFFDFDEKGYLGLYMITDHDKSEVNSIFSSTTLDRAGIV